MRRFAEFFAATYLRFDPRSLAAFRIGFGIVLMLALYWRYLDVLGEVADGQNNMIIAPTEGGVPVFVTPDSN